MKYPLLEVNTEKLRENVRILVDRCGKQGIVVAGVIKGANAYPPAIEAFAAGGAKLLASARLEHLERAKEVCPDIPRLALRVPMISEAEPLVKTADISLNSEKNTLIALDKAAAKVFAGNGKEAAAEDGAAPKHKVILMADLGDLREGFIDSDALVELAVFTEKELPNIELAGVGTNLGCYGSVMPTEDKMQALADIARRVEAKIGRKLEYVSGGATSSLIAVFGGYMPKEINMLRLGASALCGPLDDIYTAYGCEEVLELSDDAFVLTAEVVELKKKPTHPIGKLGVDAFGNKPKYVDRGERMRAIVAVGRADYGDTADIVPIDKGIEVIGASGDHTILDVEEAERKLDIGDKVKFKLKYSAVLRLTASENVEKTAVAERRK